MNVDVDVFANFILNTQHDKHQYNCPSFPVPGFFMKTAITKSQLQVNIFQYY